MNSDKSAQIRAKIAERVSRTLDYCSGLDRDAFLSNTMLQEACVFNVLQIGELAARAIEYGFDQKDSLVPWRQMRGMRNRIVHDYDGVRLDTVWDTIQNDFPDLLRILSL